MKIPMKLSIRTKLVALIFAIVLLVGGAISMYSIYQERKHSLNAYAAENRELVGLLSELVLVDMDFNDVVGLRLRLMDAQAHPRILYAYVMNPEGTVLADGSGENYLKGTRPDDPFNQAIIRATDWIANKQDRVHKIGGPVFLPGKKPIGYLVVGFSLNPAYQAIHNETFTNLVITAAGLGVGAILAIILATRITRPISQMVEASTLIGEGHFDNHVSIERNDELGILAQSINQMASRLRSTTISKAYVDDVFNFLLEPLIVLDLKGNIRSVNPAAIELLGYVETELIGKPISLVLGKENGDFSFTNEVRDKGLIDNIETKFLTKQNVSIPVLCSASMMRDRHRQPEGIVCVARDITRRAQMEEALKRSEQQVRQVLQEREQLGRDLHDGILQSLFAVSLGLEASKANLNKANAETSSHIDQAIGQLKAVMREVRQFITGSPANVSYKQDFEVNVRSLVKNMTIAHPTSFVLNIEAEAVKKVSERQALHLLNIIREGISNTLRHAQAQRGEVSVSRRGPKTHVELSDDGIGFDESDNNQRGHGLNNMKARVELMGGQWKITANPNSGTRIVVDIPHESTGIAT